MGRKSQLGHLSGRCVEQRRDRKEGLNAAAMSNKTTFCYNFFENEIKFTRNERKRCSKFFVDFLLMSQNFAANANFERKLIKI